MSRLPSFRLVTARFAIIAIGGISLLSIFTVGSKAAAFSFIGALDELVSFQPTNISMAARAVFDILAVGFVPGSIQGQNGWTGGPISIDPQVDQAVNQGGANAHTGVGSWRVSNSTINGNFNGQFAGWPHSPGLAVSAGQPSSGAGADRFNATFFFKSANAVADGSNIEVDLGNALAVRNSFLAITNNADVNSGLQLRVSEPDGVTGNFKPTQTIASGLSRTTWHRIDVLALFYDGDGNDTFQVTLDGVVLTNPLTLGTTFGTFEGFLNGSSAPYALSNLLLFRSGAPPSAFGAFSNVAAQGFFFDNVGYGASTQASPNVALALYAAAFEPASGSIASAYVNDNWAFLADNDGSSSLTVGDTVRNNNDTVSPGTIAAVYGVNGFGIVTSGAFTGSLAGAAAIQDAINNVADGGIVRVLEGNYNQAQVLIQRAMTVTGAGADITTINGGNTSIAAAGLVRIDLPLDGNVVFSGFNLTNPGLAGNLRAFIFCEPDESTSSVTISHNRITGANDSDYGLYSTSAVGSIEFFSNELTNNANNPILIERPVGAINVHHNSISGNNSTAYFSGTYSGNDVTGKQRVADNTINASEASAISFTGGGGGDPGKYSDVEITNNVITQLGAGNGINLTNGASTGNGPLGAIENPIVSGNRITGTDLAGSKGIRLSGLITNAAITGNDVRDVDRGFSGEVNNGHSATGIQAHFNNFVGSTTGFFWAGAAAANAENNWWGCNAGPGNAGCDSVGGGGGAVDFNPRIVLGTTAAPNSISPGGTSALTANMKTNSDGATPVGTIPNIPVGFSATQGTMSPTSGTITSGLANSMFTSTTTNSGTACATVDNQLTCSNITVNTAPTINTVFGLIRQRGTPASNSTIANVTDIESGSGSVVVTVNGGATATVNGVTVSNIVNTNGTITADVVADCTATAALFTLTATDNGGLTATASLGVLALPNTAPALTYSSQTMTAGTTLSFGPATGPSDNGTVGSVTLQSVTPNTGLALNVDPAGQVNITGAPTVGVYTVVVSVTDNCGAATTAVVTVNVTCPTITVGPASLANGTATAPYSQTITAGPAGGNYTFAVTSGALPAGLTLNPTSGLLSGTPTANGTFNFRITATGFGGCSGWRDYTVTIAKADTATTVVSSQPTSTFGEAVTFTATVTPSAPATGIPTGTMNFLDNGNPIAACQAVGLNEAGQAACPASTLTAGTHTISAVYSGSGVYNTSTGTTSQTVGKANATCTVTGYNVTYDGSPHTATGSCTGIGGAADVLTGLNLTATTHTNAGSYPTDPWTFTDVTGNYNSRNGTVADNIGKKALTVTADDKTRVYGAPNPALTYQITGFVNGETLGTSGVTGIPNLTTTAIATSPVSGSPYPITPTTGTLASANYSFIFVPGTLTVTQAATTTTITNAAALAANPTTIGQAYAVNWQTSPVAPSTGVPTGTVTVSDGTDTCTAAVGALTCNLTSTTFGPKNITATYSGDANMTGSTSAAVSHTVGIGITGNVRQFGTNANLAGVTITLSGSAAGVTVTDANGNYGFGVPVSGGSYVLTPSGLSKTYEPILRSYTNVTANITNADFTAYDILGAGANPRHVRVQNTVTTGGEAAVVPVMMVSRGNEVKIAFSLAYDMAVMGTPTVACGYDTAGCSLTVNTSQPGRVGITLTPAAVLTPGLKEIVKVTFQTVPNTLTSTPVSFDDIPTVRDIRNAEGNPLPAIYNTGFVTFTQNSLGLEGDVVDANGDPAGGDGVKANDVTVISQRVTSPNTTPPFATTPNQFQRADVNVPCGNGGIDAGDVTVITQLALGIIAPIGACGPATPTGSTSRPEDSEGTARIIRAVNTTAVAGGTVTVSFVIVSQGNEASASYSVTFPQGTLTNPQVAAGSGVPSGTTVLTNSEAAQGRIGVLIATPNSYTAGTRQMITITFNVSAQATAGTYPIGFSSTPVGQNVSAAAGGALLPTTYEPGNVVIGPTAAGVEVSGKVQTADGRGLRNATVTITDAEGNRRTATTGSFGSYRFDDIEAGKTYVIAVTSQRFRFASRTVNVTDSLTDVDFAGQE